jgi:hypothetical protein
MSSPRLEPLDQLLGELCITHQLTEVALRHAESAVARTDLEQHRRAVEDLGLKLRVLSADLAGAERPVVSPDMDGRAKLGYGYAQVGGLEQASFASTLSSLGAELSIAAHEADQTEDAISRPMMSAIRNELRSFEATVREWERRPS